MRFLYCLARFAIIALIIVIFSSQSFILSLINLLSKTLTGGLCCIRQCSRVWNSEDEDSSVLSTQEELTEYLVEEGRVS